MSRTMLRSSGKSASGSPSVRAANVMAFAPIGIGAAIAVTVGKSGLGVLRNLGILVLTLYGALIVFAVGYYILNGAVGLDAVAFLVILALGAFSMFRVWRDQHRY